MRRWGSPCGQRPHRDHQQGAPTGSSAALSAAGKGTPSPEEAAACASFRLPGLQAAGLERPGPVWGGPRPRLQAARDRQPLGARLQGLRSARSCGDRSQGPPDRPAGPCPAAPEPSGEEEFAGDRHLGAKRLCPVRVELGHSLRLLPERLSRPDGERISSQVAWGFYLAAGALPTRGMFPRSSRPLGRPHRMSFPAGARRAPVSFALALRPGVMAARLALDEVVGVRVPGPQLEVASDWRKSLQERLIALLVSLHS
jgi:hypothetical protein